jgi:hypothetical protein
MERCKYEFYARGLETKHSERTRDEQIAQRRVSLALFLMERGSELESIEEPEALGTLVGAHTDRLSVADFMRLAELLQAKFGPAFVRQSGLPVRTPSLRVA